MKFKRKKRKLDDCRLFCPEIAEPMYCSFPDQEECARYTKIIYGKKGLKVGISLCRYREKTIGRKQCIREQLALKDWKR